MLGTNSDLARLKVITVKPGEKFPGMGRRYNYNALKDARAFAKDFNLRRHDEIESYMIPLAGDNGSTRPYHIVVFDTTPEFNELGEVAP